MQINHFSINTSANGSTQKANTKASFNRNSVADSVSFSANANYNMAVILAKALLKNDKITGEWHLIERNNHSLVLTAEDKNIGPIKLALTSISAVREKYTLGTEYNFKPGNMVMATLFARKHGAIGYTLDPTNPIYELALKVLKAELENAETDIAKIIKTAKSATDKTDPLEFAGVFN